MLILVYQQNWHRLDLL